MPGAAWNSTPARRPWGARPGGGGPPGRGGGAPPRGAPAAGGGGAPRPRPPPPPPHGRGGAGAYPAGDPIALLAERAAAGHAPTLAALDRAGRALGLALASAVELIDPDGLVLGGAYAELADWLIPSVRAELAARVTVRPWAPEALRPSALGRRGPLLGAALTTVRRIVADPTLLPVG
ncbi:ROK family protein [Streptomyces sp. NPDC051555]|uniref:ROK family protein n=1 Tax=Streptomyces sp. NPDC051555 TaxID=3365657 RepID=UPI0037A02FCC